VKKYIIDLAALVLIVSFNILNFVTVGNGWKWISLAAAILGGILTVFLIIQIIDESRPATEIPEETKKPRRIRMVMRDKQLYVDISMWELYPYNTQDN
jgi:hypothetical protein